MKRPFFSIIVVSLNAENLIRKTIDSVLNQNFNDYEIIVKDAVSSDNTLAQIPKDDRIHIYSEKDSGIYDGMNQAISYSSGKYLIFLNCGDFFATDSVLSHVYETAKELDDNNSIIYGDYQRNSIKAKQPSGLSDFYLYRTPLCHQTVFFGSGVLKKLSNYNTEYKILADYDLTLRCYRANVEFVYCPYVISDYLGGGVSESEKGRVLRAKEYKQIRDSYFSKQKQKYYDFKLALSLKGFRQKLASDKSPKLIRKIYRGLVNLVNR